MLKNEKKKWNTIMFIFSKCNTKTDMSALKGLTGFHFKIFGIL